MTSEVVITEEMEQEEKQLMEEGERKEKEMMEKVCCVYCFQSSIISGWINNLVY